MKRVLIISLIALFSSTAMADDLTVVVTNAYSGPGSGSIDLTITGGVSPYNVLWVGPAGFMATTEDISGLDTGTYILEVTDTYCGIAQLTVQVTDQPPSAIEEINGISSIAVYPNPFDESFTIAAESNISGDCLIELTDISGRVIFEQAIEMSEGHNSFTIQPSDLATGVYSLRILNDEGVLFKNELIRN